VLTVGTEVKEPSNPLQTKNCPCALSPPLLLGVSSPDNPIPGPSLCSSHQCIYHPLTKGTKSHFSLVLNPWVTIPAPSHQHCILSNHNYICPSVPWGIGSKTPFECQNPMLKFLIRTSIALAHDLPTRSCKRHHL
jgi:hypothetical protein